MDPAVGRIAFNIGLALMVLALIPLPFLDIRSAEFIVDVLTVFISFMFLIFVSYEVRRQAKNVKVRNS